jgi:predicted PolB exonuclease-like 3'-5' exonuclease
MTPTWLVLDIETVGRPDVADYTDEIRAAGNLKDPEKIAADLAKKRDEAIANAALDWNANAIVAVGYQTEETSEPTVLICRDVEEEAFALRRIWRVYQDRSRRLVTFNGAGFDIPTLVQRSRFLRVPVPRLDQRKYGNTDQIDLYRLLTFDDTQRTFVIRRTLSNFCKLFALDVPCDAHDGSDIARLVAEGDWDAIAAHVRTDVVKTRMLAERLDVLAVTVPWSADDIGTVSKALDEAF